MCKMLLAENIDGLCNFRAEIWIFMNWIISPPHEKSNFISHFMLWLLNSNETGELEPEKVILDRFF